MKSSLLPVYQSWLDYISLVPADEVEKKSKRMSEAVMQIAGGEGDKKTEVAAAIKVIHNMVVCQSY